ncbi:hypothetical protein [Xylophilus sp. GOD-11R]|uniref:hypothetical protein n=1 Tax=Xylophilus sp. GOD-11R TaxID=3089814 RepID=UPI00298CD4AC|nr:hypothetical protein [Xylophilus sp. GOD-11R]WPB58300.1 hypothetical protein R9X41_06560 [Xylophilus sp. GOD-11R]
MAVEKRGERGRVHGRIQGPAGRHGRAAPAAAEQGAAHMRQLIAKDSDRVNAQAKAAAFAGGN